MYLSMIEFDNEIKKICPEVKQIYRMVNGKRETFYKLPSLKRCRKLFEKAVGIKIDWSNTGSTGNNGNNGKREIS